VAIRLHADDAALLREAIRYTAAETGFSARLIEKDYFCSVALEYLAGECGSLTFKGGTCLSKIHGSFYRLSEDLDFSIPTAVDSARGERRRSAEPLRQALGRVEERLPGFRVAETLRGRGATTQRVRKERGERALRGVAHEAAVRVHDRDRRSRSRAALGRAGVDARSTTRPHGIVICGDARDGMSEWAPRSGEERRRARTLASRARRCARATIGALARDARRGGTRRQMGRAAAHARCVIARRRSGFTPATSSM